MQPVERVRTAARAFERLVAHLRAAPARTAATRSPSSTSRRPTGRAPGRARARDLRPRPGADLGDRAGDRHPHRPGHARRRRACARTCSDPSEGFRGRGWNSPAVGVPLDPTDAASSRRRRGSMPASPPRVIVRTVLVVVAVAISLYLRLPAAQADRLGADRDVPGRRAVRPGELPQPAGCGAASRSRSSTSALLLVPIGIAALIVPPLVTQGNNLVQNLPELRAGRAGLRATRTRRCASSSATTTSPRSSSSRREKLPARIGDAASVLGDIGLGAGQLAVRAVHDPRPDGVPARQRAQLGRPRARAATAGARRERMRRALDHMGARGRRLRRRRARAGDGRRRASLTSCW